MKQIRNKREQQAREVLDLEGTVVGTVLKAKLVQFSPTIHFLIDTAYLKETK